jgi:hypothetical protein
MTPSKIKRTKFFGMSLVLSILISFSSFCIAAESAPKTNARRTPEERGAADIATHRTYIELVQAQSRNAEWAAKAEKAITEEMPKVLGNSATLINVDCRSSACLALIEWSSFSVAQEYWNIVVLAEMPVRCDREITLPPPKDERARYREHLVMVNCRFP